MTEKENFVQTGDYRDIPMAIGLIVIAWNSCEGEIRMLLRSLVSVRSGQPYRLSEILIVEMGAVGLANALRCYADEFPDSAKELAEELRFVADYYERARVHRNYYIHGITSVTKFGIDWTNKLFEDEIPLHEAVVEGPCAQIYIKSAKGKQKFIMESIRSQTLIDFNNALAIFCEYINRLQAIVNHFLRDENYAETAPLPPRPPLLNRLAKPDLDHPKMKQRPALARHDSIEDDPD